MNKAGLYCSFCGKSESEVKHIVEGPGKVGICDECSELVESIMEPYRPLRAAASTSTEAVGDRIDAERWRALMSSQKMHWMGSAGFNHVPRPEAPEGSRALEDQDPIPRPGDPWHFGMEFWFGIEADPQYPDTFERRCMVAYVDAIRALSTPPGAP